MRTGKGNRMTRLLLAMLLFAASLPACAQWTVTVVTSANSMHGEQTQIFTPADSTLDMRPAQPTTVQFDLRRDGMTPMSLVMGVPAGETIGPREYTTALAFPYGRENTLKWGNGCREYGAFSIRQLVVVTGKVMRLEAVARTNCASPEITPITIAINYQAPALNFSIVAPELTRSTRTYYGDTAIFGLTNATPAQFDYTVSGQRDKWAMHFAVPPGQAQLAKGVYLTEGVAAPGVAGMDIALNGTRKAEWGKFEVLTVTYRNGALVQLSARFWFYSDLARTQVVRSGKINFWK